MTTLFDIKAHKGDIGGSTYTPYKFNGKELDDETGYYYYGARYYDPGTALWFGVDPLAGKYPMNSPYVYCNGNPVKYVDSDGRDWTDASGNVIENHDNVKVYIFYDPRSDGEGFTEQSKQMYNDAEAIYGPGSVAMSAATTESQFVDDWENMYSKDVREVNLNYHGNNQTLMLNSNKDEYITATGNGKTNRFGANATNVNDLPNPKGNISNAQLNINSCKSNSTTQYELKGSKLTLMQSFLKHTNFKTVRGTSYGVSYDKKTKQPFPGHSWWRGNWDVYQNHR